MSDIAFAPATNLADRIRRREITAAELLDIYIDRLQRFDGGINAVVLVQQRAIQPASHACSP